MSIFVVIATNSPDAVLDRVKSVYPDDHYIINDTVALVSSDGTSIDVSKNIGIVAEAGSKPVGSAIVVSIASYYGRASMDTWDWIKRKWESP